MACGENRLETRESLHMARRLTAALPLKSTVRFSDVRLGQRWRAMLSSSRGHASFRILSKEHDRLHIKQIQIKNSV